MYVWKLGEYYLTRSYNVNFTEPKTFKKTVMDAS